MGLILSDVGADAVLGKYFNGTVPVSGNNLTLKLFTNNITPADTDISTTYIEVSGGGYAPKILTAGSWTITPANDPSDAVYASQIWTFTGPISANPDIYGYYVVNADNVLIWSEKAAGTFTPSASGDQLTVVPKFQLSKGTPT